MQIVNAIFKSYKVGKYGVTNLNDPAQNIVSWRGRLKSLLKARGEKITAISLELGFNRDYISRITNNPNSNPSMNNLEIICAYLEISIAELMTGLKLEAEKARTIETISKMGQKEMERLGDYLKKSDLTDH